MVQANKAQFAQEVTEKLLTLLSVTGSVTVDSKEEEGEESLHINISTESETGLLIGARGTTLLAIQSFIAMALRQEYGAWVRVVVNIGDWREKHEEYLKNLATQAAERARATGESQHLYNLSPSQRRSIHLILSQEDGVVTESQGEGDSRYLIVKPE